MLRIELRDDANDNYREVIELSMSIDNEMILTDENFYGTRELEIAEEKLINCVRSYCYNHNINLPWDWYFGKIEAK